MERFRGNLATYRLQLLVPALFDGKPATGTLILERAGVRREFELVDGCLSSESSNLPHEHLSQVLADLNILDTTRTAAAFEAAEAQGMSLGAFLAERNFVEVPRLIEALSYKAREAFFDCYDWECGDVTFESTPPPKRNDIQLDLKLSNLHRDAMARQREWKLFREQFPSEATTFNVHPDAREHTIEDKVLLQLAGKGAPLSALLSSTKEGRLSAARRVLQLYRRGALTPREHPHALTQKSADVVELVALARRYLDGGNFEGAAELASQALEHAAVPEAQALFRQAELKLAEILAHEVSTLEGKVVFQPLSKAPPSELNSDDLYLYSKLRSSRSIGEAMLASPMGELAAYRSIGRLVDSGLITFNEQPARELRLQRVGALTKLREPNRDAATGS